jgi:hypothetical protein
LKCVPLIYIIIVIFINAFSCISELDGGNKLKFFYIDLLESIIRTVQDPTLEGKLYHTFEYSRDQEGMRIFDKVNSGLVFESFYLLDTEVAPLIAVVASDASHQGNTIQHPLYRKS